MSSAQLKSGGPYDCDPTKESNTQHPTPALCAGLATGGRLLGPHKKTICCRMSQHIQCFEMLIGWSSSNSKTVAVTSTHIGKTLPATFSHNTCRPGLRAGLYAKQREPPLRQRVWGTKEAAHAYKGGNSTLQLHKSTSLGERLLHHKLQSEQAFPPAANTTV